MSLLGKSTLFALALAFVLLATSEVNAHGWMSSPTPRGQFLTPPKPSYVEIMPATTNVSDPMLACRNDPAPSRDKFIHLTAGTIQSIQLEFTAKHVGDCFVYLSYDGEKPIEQMKWFKIWAQHDCRNSQNYDIPLPSYLPAGDHVVFRWEWYALHKYPIVEYYSQCADATMSAAVPAAGSALTGATATGLPSPMVSIPGNLPVLVEGDWKTNQNNYWWPWDTQAMFFTGPPIASFGQNTQKPTTIPVTSAPSVKPTVPATPTLPATPTVAPTAPASSVKLNILAGSGAWWFVVTVSGSRSNEIVSMELKDAGLFPNFTPMYKSWVDATLGQVWVFNPSPIGALTVPITIKASVASGNPVYFTSNKYSNTVIDSGSNF